jgi:SsrA-binding protein
VHTLEKKLLYGVGMIFNMMNNINIENKKVKFEYTILDTYQAGIILTGTEVKSIRLGNVNLTDTYCYFKDDELFVKNISISLANGEPKRERKLLLKKSQLRKLKSKLINGLTIVPTKIYFNERNLIKVEIVLAQGKKLHDKRESIKTRDIQREIQRNI